MGSLRLTLLGGFDARLASGGALSLRQTLTLLRKALAAVEPSPLSVDRVSAALDPDAVDVDAVDFLRRIEAGAPTDLEAATALYAGDLLEGFAIRDPAFEAWLEQGRRQFREALHRALTLLLEHKTKSGVHEEAVAVARRLLALDPLQERVHRGHAARPLRRS